MSDFQPDYEYPDYDDYYDSEDDIDQKLMGLLSEGNTSNMMLEEASYCCGAGLVRDFTQVPPGYKGVPAGRWTRACKDHEGQVYDDLEKLYYLERQNEISDNYGLLTIYLNEPQKGIFGDKLISHGWVESARAWGQHSYNVYCYTKETKEPESDDFKPIFRYVEPKPVPAPKPKAELRKEAFTKATTKRGAVH